MDGPVRPVRLEDASVGRGAGRSDDRPKGAGHDCRSASVRDFQLAAGRGCRSAWDATVDPQDEAARPPPVEQHPAGRESVGREHRDAELEDADRARLGRVDPRQGAKAAREGRWELALPLAEEFAFAARPEREPRAWLQQAERHAVGPVLEVGPVSAEPLELQNLLRRAPVLPVPQDAELELAVRRQVAAQLASRRPELVAEFAEPAQRPELKARAQQASGELPWRPLPWPPFRLRPLLALRHPARLVPEWCGALFRRRPPG